VKSIIEIFDEWKEMQTPDNERGETMTINVLKTSLSTSTNSPMNGIIQRRK